MQIATYVDGRAIEFDEATRQLSIGGAILSNDHVLGYDRAGQLAWVSPDMRNWFYQQAGVPAAGPPAPVKKKKTGLVVGVILGLVLLCGIVSVFSGGDDDGAANNAESPTGVATEVGEANQAPPSPKVGEKFTTEKFEITIVSVETKKQVGSEFFEEKPAEGGEYIAVRWKYKNISKEPIGMFSTPSLKLVNPDGIKFDADIGASGAYATELDLTAKIVSDLNPGITVEDAQVFEVEKGSFDKASWQVFVDADEDVTFTLK